MSLDINLSNIGESLNRKADLDFGNVEIGEQFKQLLEAAGITFVKESNYDESTFTWYRIWSDGWVEQGGPIVNDTTTYQLPIAMRDTNYYVNVSWDGGKSQTFYPNDWQVRSLTTTSFYTTASRNGGNVQGRCWEVKGWKA